MNAQSGKAATAHTPTPWFATDLRQVRSHVGFVALTSGSDFNVAIEEANAAFIVRACNSHDALVAALKPFAALLPHFQREHTSLRPRTGAIHSWASHDVNDGAEAELTVEMLKDAAAALAAAGEGA